MTAPEPGRMLAEEREVRLSVWEDLKCRLGLHEFTDAEGDELGAHQTCIRCGHVKRARQPPPDQKGHLM